MNLPQWFKHTNLFYLVCIDIDGNFTFVNDFFKSQSAFAGHNLIGESSTNFVHPDDQQISIQAVQSIFHKNVESTLVQLRKPNATKESKFQWTHWELSPLKDEFGNVEQVICVGTDIGETQKALLRAVEFERRIESVILNISDGLCLLDTDLNFVKINPTTQKLLDVPERDILSYNLFDLFQTKGLFKNKAEFEIALQKNETITFDEFSEELNAWFKIIAYPSPEGLTIFYRDITKENWFEHQIIKSENKLKAVLNSTPDSNILLSPNLEVLSFNKVAAQSVKHFFGEDLVEGADFNKYILNSVGDNFHLSFQRALKGEFIENEHELLMDDGKKIWFYISFTPVFNDQNELIGVSYDAINIDQRKQIEFKLNKQNAKLQNIAWQQSHEIRKPVANILGLVELMKLTKDESERQELLDYLQFVTKELDEVIHKIVSEITHES